MSENNQEGYLSLGWIINESEQGLFLAVADETIQREIVKIYGQGTVGIYDYRRHPGVYSFRDLSEWITVLPLIRTFIIANFQFAIQREEDLRRLNASRDMLAGLGKNLIFLTTPYGDDQLSVGAYDFYSFLKLRIIFHNYEVEWRKPEEELLPVENILIQEREWGSEEAKAKLEETYILLEEAVDAKHQARYRESEELLIKAKRIREKLLGEEHLEVAAVNHILADVYERQGKFAEAEILCKKAQKALSIRKRLLGKDHPSSAAVYKRWMRLHRDNELKNGS